MTDADVERFARAAGCFTPGASRNYWAVTDQMLRRFAEMVQAAERQRWSVWCSDEMARNRREVDATGHQRPRGAADALERAVQELGGPNKMFSGAPRQSD